MLSSDASEVDCLVLFLMLPCQGPYVQATHVHQWTCMLNKSLYCNNNMMALHTLYTMDYVILWIDIIEGLYQDLFCLYDVVGISM